MLATMNLGIVVPTYDGNPENTRIERYLAHSIELLRKLEPMVSVKIFEERGEKVPADIANVTEWTRHDRAIAKCRWDGMHHAFEWGADWIIMVDTDVTFTPDFLYAMLRSWLNAEAKTCHVVSSTTNKCRHIDFPSSVMLPDDTETQPIAGEVIMLKRSLWDRMNKDVAVARMNEDFEIAEKVRAAGAVYYLVNYRCLSD